MGKHGGVVEEPARSRRLTLRHVALICGGGVLMLAGIAVVVTTLGVLFFTNMDWMERVGNTDGSNLSAVLTLTAVGVGLVLAGWGLLASGLDRRLRGTKKSAAS